MANELAIREENANSVATWQVMKEQAGVLVKTGFLPEAITTPEKAMAIMLTGKELGIPPMQALRGVHVIKGTPTIKPELMLALCIQRIPGFKYSFGKCDDKTATFTAQRPEMLEPFVSTFTMDDAKRAGLTTNSTWSKYPANMLRWRAVANALHIVAPDVLVGVYTPDEMGAVVDESGDYVATPTAVAEETTLTFDAEVVQDEQPDANIATKPQIQRVHAMAGELFGNKPEGVAKFKKLKTQVLGESKASNDMTKDEISAVMDALQVLIDEAKAA